MANSYRCRYCKENWPHEDTYSRCPLCREPCNLSGNAAMDSEHAASRKKEHDFGWYLWDQWSRTES